MTIADHIQAIIDHAGHVLFPTVVVNTRSPSNVILRKYREQNAQVVEADEARVRDMGITILKKELLSEANVIRHDTDLLAEAILETCRG